jgi:predicted TIM-barrel fold metal-dependent hydrolase
MSPDLFARHRVIDTDTHITEPPDTWTSRVSRKWGNDVPHIERVGGNDVWVVAGRPSAPPGIFTMAGFDGTVPDFRATWEELPASAYDARARLEHMDREGIWAQVLYPNVGGFGNGAFLGLNEPELMLECVRAYNDFLIDWTSEDPRRLVPVMALPFWDVPTCVREIERCAAKGHKAVLMGSQPQAFGQPALIDRHWDPIWAAAQAAELSISFHIGGGDMSDLLDTTTNIGTRANFARVSALFFIDNSRCLADIFFGGICHRFPKLDFVSVESGVGWIPPTLESFDWQWRNGGVAREHPEYELLPSEYFRRQVYGCFWFEEQARDAIAKYPDNFLYETDFPHPTSMSPGPQTPADRPRVYADRALAGLPEEALAKVLHDTAARIYKLD